MEQRPLLAPAKRVEAQERGSKACEGENSAAALDDLDADAKVQFSQF